MLTNPDKPKAYKKQTKLKHNIKIGNYYKYKYSNDGYGYFKGEVVKVTSIDVIYNQVNFKLKTHPFPDQKTSKTDIKSFKTHFKLIKNKQLAKSLYG